MPPGFQISHTEFARVLRRVGYSVKEIETITGRLPDPIDVERDGKVLAGYGLSREHLMDRMGASP